MNTTLSAGGLLLAPGIELRQYVHPFFNANAWLLCNDTHALLIDTASNGNEDGNRVADFVAQSGRELVGIVATNPAWGASQA